MKNPDTDQLGAESSGIPQLRGSSFAARVLAFCRAHRLLVLFLGAFAVRVAFVFAFGATALPSQRADDPIYDTIAYRLVTKHQYTNTWYPPGYPLFLALNYAVFGRSWFIARLVQAGLGAATCLLIDRLGSKVFSDRVGLVAGVLLAVYPGHVFFSWRLMAEPLYILLLIWSLLLALSLVEDPQPLRSSMLGIIVGADQLVKANLFLFPAMLIVWFVLAARASGRKRMLCVTVLIAGMAMPMLIQPMVNYLSTGRARALPSNVGAALWQGNNPLAVGFCDWNDDAPAAKSFIERHGFDGQLQTAGPFEKDRIYRSLTWAWIRENPWRFLALMPRKLNNAFGLFPRAQVFEGNPRSRIIVHLLSYGLIAPFALGGMIAALRRWRACSLLYVTVFSYLPTVLLFWGTPRYTLLIIPVLLIFASFALIASYDYLVGSRRLPELRGTFGQPA
jgi:4-amino-4-deoxy-L-arabinose transferase-like glycosyltransferase